ncbi:MAG: DUF4386 domain-containing protein [Chitinophagales bacterium]|nr:DUF4386 domain-containing protein [Chitinophagales bacterium]
MNSNLKLARLAGFLYLLVIIFGVFAELYVRAKIISPESAAETVQNIIANKELFRLGFVSDLIMQLAFFFLPFPLYLLFKKVNKNYAAAMVLSVMVGVAIMCLNMLHHLAAILILEKGDLLTAFSTEQLNVLVTLMLDLHKNGYRIAQLFFGIWLFPLGYLVYQSGFIPKIIGVLLMIACFSFLLDFFLFFLLSNYSPDTSSIVTFPTTIGEFSICLWLLIKGVRTNPV